MSPKDTDSDDHINPGGRSVSRRDFLKMAGIAGAAVGAGTGLGGILAACGEEAQTTTTAGATTTSGGAATTTTGGATTTVSAAAEMGAEIKIGFVTPKTGPLAPFASTDAYMVERFTEFVGDGKLLGDKKKHPIKVEVADSQSDPNRAGQVGADLIQNSGVTLMTVASSPDTVVPVAAQCEVFATPCFATDTPYQAFQAGEPAGGFKYVRLAFGGVEDFTMGITSLWKDIPTNKKVGIMYGNDADGNALGQFTPPIMREAGLTVVDAKSYQPGTEDYTQQIQVFKKEGCEIGWGIFTTPDFTNFWKQCHQQGWVPSIYTVSKALPFSSAVEAVGAPIAYNLTAILIWAPTWPYKVYPYGDTNQQFADEFTKRTSEQWSCSLLHHVIFEMAYWALEHADDPTSKESINAAAAKTKYEGTAGLIDFSGPVMPQPPAIGPGHVAANIYKTPSQIAQWVKGTHGFPFDFVSVGNVGVPDIPVDAKPLPIVPNPS